jgi:hypothetical protein
MNVYDADSQAGQIPARLVISQSEEEAEGLAELDEMMSHAVVLLSARICPVMRPTMTFWPM